MTARGKKHLFFPYPKWEEIGVTAFSTFGEVVYRTFSRKVNVLYKLFPKSEGFPAIKGKQRLADK